MKICILTAGKGTRMGDLCKYINKALLPIKNKAIISHIIEYFPSNYEFVIALGYLGQQVHDYLVAAHPNKKLSFVNIQNFDGLGSGPGLSLLQCEPYLQEPFYYMPCDCILHDKIDNVPQGNWIGVNERNNEESHQYCNVSVKNGKVIDIVDKEKCGSDYFAFTAPLFVYDYKEFWSSLRNSSIIRGEHQISNGMKGLMKNSDLYAIKMKWTNLGDIDKFQKAQEIDNTYNFSKPDELIYFVNDRVLKFFFDEKTVTNRIKRANLKSYIFPKVIRSGNQFYYYTFFDGKVLYDCITPSLFKQLLKWLDEKVWEHVNIETKQMYSLCEDFYYKKTLTRIAQFQTKYPEYNFPPKVNNQDVLSIKDLIQKIPWKLLFNGIPSFIHGDLNFGNILYNEESNRFLLIDWRQDFAGIIEFGDLYYDLAKLLGGIIINYELVKKNLFTIDKDTQNITVNFNWDTKIEHQKIFEEFIKSKQLDQNKIRLLTGLTYINMAPLHNPPFNYGLMALGSLMISQEIYKIENG